MYVHGFYFSFHHPINQTPLSILVPLQTLEAFVLGAFGEVRCGLQSKLRRLCEGHITFVEGVMLHVFPTFGILWEVTILFLILLMVQKSGGLVEIHHLQGFIHPRRCRIYPINSREGWPYHDLMRDDLKDHDTYIYIYTYQDYQDHIFNFASVNLPAVIVLHFSPCCTGFILVSFPRNDRATL